MAASVFKYSSVNTKTRALYSKLLTKHDYDELLEKKTVNDVAEYLKKNTGYRSLLSEISGNLVRRSELEQIFKGSLYKDIMSLRNFLRGEPGEFLKIFFMRFEIEDLKMLLRIVYTGQENKILKNSFVFLKSCCNIDFTKLCTSNNIPDVIENLKGSEYYKVLRPFSDVTREQNLFDIEMALDLHYFMKVLKLKKKLLKGADRKVITYTYGVEIDILNILMIYRCKKLFHFSKERTFKYVIPFWHRLSRKQLVKMSESTNSAEFMQELLKTKYSSIFKPGEEHLWELNSMNYLYRIYKRNLHKNMFDLGVIMAYLHLKEIDVRNIITIIEGIRYELPKEEIRSYLTGIYI